MVNLAVSINWAELGLKTSRGGLPLTAPPSISSGITGCGHKRCVTTAVFKRRQPRIHALAIGVLCRPSRGSNVRRLCPQEGVGVGGGRVRHGDSRHRWCLLSPPCEWPHHSLPEVSAPPSPTHTRVQHRFTCN